MPMPVQRIACALLIILSIIVASHAQQPAAPSAVLPLTTYGFGDIKKGEVISYVFIIRNTGNADLVINNFVAGCGCEVLDADRMIAPGKEGNARIEVDTALQPGGDLLKMAWLHTNDPQRPTIPLTLTANIITGPDGGMVKDGTTRTGHRVGPLLVSPGLMVDFTVAPGQTAHTEFSITVERGPLSLQRIETTSKLLNARLETVEAGKKYKVVLETLPATETGLHQEHFRIVTDDPKTPYLPMKIRLLVRRIQ